MKIKILLLALVFAGTAAAQPSPVPASLTSASPSASHDTIGWISLANHPIPVYFDEKTNQTGYTRIKSVVIVIKDGTIWNLEVNTDRGKYANQRAPIAVSPQRFTKGDRLRIHNTDKEFISLDEALQLDRWQFNYFPDDGTVVLDASNPRQALTRNVGVNTVIDLRLYTDAIGLFGKEPNGLVQTELRTKQFLHRMNVRNCGWFVFQYIKLNANAAKFDSKYKAIDSATFNRTSFLQRSWVSAEVAVNIFNTWVEPKSASQLYLDFGAGINAASLARKFDTVNITGTNLFTELGFNLKSSHNVGADLITRATVNYSPETDFDHNNRAMWFLKFTGQVFWNPKNDDGSGRIFGRVNYVMATNTDEKKKHYFQFQLGYSVLLSKALGKSN